MDIPWLAEVRSSLSRVDYEHIFESPHEIDTVSKKDLWSALYMYYRKDRLDGESRKPTIATFMSIKNTQYQLVSYLTNPIGRWERGLLFRLRAGTVTFLLSFPLGFHTNLDSLPCPCDGWTG